MIMMAIGNLGIYFFARIRITSAPAPMANDSQFIYGREFQICFASSRNSPRPAGLPISFGTCIKMIVTAMPLIKPPMTGVEIKSTILSALRK